MAGNKQAKGELSGKPQMITHMLNVFMRGSETGDEKIRAAKLVEALYDLAVKAENPPAVRLAAINTILERIDGKVVEKKEVRSLKLEGVIYLPAAAETAKDVIDVCVEAES